MKKLTIICAYYPDRDPRFGWIANMAADYFDVTVLGFDEHASELPEIKNRRYKAKTLDAKQIYTLVRNLKGRRRNELNRALIHKGLSVNALLSKLRRVMLWDALLRYRQRLSSFIERLNFGADEQPAAMQKQAAEAGPVPDERGEKQDDAAASHMAKKLNLKDKVYFGIQNYMTLCGTKLDSLTVSVSKLFNTLYIHIMPELMLSNKLPDIVLCSDLSTLEIGQYLKLNYDIPVIYDAHEFYPYCSSSSDKEFVRYFLDYEDSIIHDIDYVVSVNPLICEQIAKAYNLDKTFSVPNCAPRNVKEAPFECDYPSSLPDGCVKFLFQGGISAERGFEELLKAWKLLGTDSGAVLLLRGPDGEQRNKYEQLAQALGILNETVYFLPSIEERYLVSAASYADVGIIPYPPITINNKYCCPNKLSQYMKAGLAILACDTQYVSNRIAAYGCGMIYRPFEPEDICKCVRTLCADKALVQKLGRKAAAAFQDDYNWEKQSKPMREIFQALC